jgi:hypothetical protein
MKVLEEKGSVIGAAALGKRVRIWVQSPTGDMSDSFSYDIPCITEEQASLIAETWRQVWNLN